MDNQDPYIKMVFQNAVEQIRAFGATLEQLQKALVFKQEPEPKLSYIICIGPIPDFEIFAESVAGVNVLINNYPTERKFFFDGVDYINISQSRPKGYYPKCDALIFLGGYLSPEYLKIIEDFQDQQNAYLIDPFTVSKMIQR